MYPVLENYYECILCIELAIPRSLKYKIHFTKNYTEYNLILENPGYLVFSYVHKTHRL